MNRPPAHEKATLPPTLPGLGPGWSRLVDIVDAGGTNRRFHVLDTQVPDPELTVLCVHGNPSWSYLWRDVIAQAPPTVRVVACDHLDMGFSERTGADRDLGDRIDDLDRLTTAIGIDGPVVTLAHDWGGPISLGWARRHLAQLRGLILTNTAVGKGATAPPVLISAARLPGVLRAVTQRTPLFIRAALRMSSPEPDASVRRGFLAPYRTRDRRAGIRAFVADIPLHPTHPTSSTLEQIALDLKLFADVPALLMWGTRDPVFGERYLHDLEDRLPHADVHRFVDAAHFVTEDAPVAAAVWDWIDERLSRKGVTGSGPALDEPQPVASLLTVPEGAHGALVTEWREHGWRSVEAPTFLSRVRRLAAGFRSTGVAGGDRVAVMIPPGIDLTAVVYACWEAGLTVVLVDAGLGIRNMHRAVRAADPDWLVGIPPAMVAARALGWPGRRIVVGEMDPPLRRSLRVQRSLRETEFAGEGSHEHHDPGGDPPAVVGFTSGSTGPSKGVRYRRSQLGAQRDAIAALYDIGPTDRLVAAFAPFALYGPALGIASVVPDLDITRPGTLTGRALCAAVEQIDATLVFLSPAAMANVVATAGELTAEERAPLGRVRLVLCAGAPVRLDLLQAMADLTPAAALHTPYGMTEVLPVADISLSQRMAVGEGHGTCVGKPVDGVGVRIHPIDTDGRPGSEPTDQPGVLGEVVVRARHGKDSYDRLWWTEHRSRTADGWHCTGDVGHLDGDGFLWIGGRLQHLMLTADGPLAPVVYEHAAERLPGVIRAAAVGVGPVGTQVPVIVIETSDRSRHPLPGPEVTDAVRREVAETGCPGPAAVLAIASIPVDKRHNSKVDRTRVAAWAEKVLAGKRPVRW